LSGAGSVNYTGTIYLNNIATAAANQATSLKLTAPAGGTATFSGLMRDSNATLSNGPLCPPVFVLGEGTVKLSGNNTYNGTTSVRGGTLLLGHNNAMGAATSAVSLGDTVTAPSGGDVVAATTAELTGTYTWSAGVFTWTAGAPTALDGVSLTANARILVKDASGSPVQNGVYTRTSSTVWTRSTDLNTAAGYTAGLRVHVAGGTLNGGKNFYLQYGLLGTAVLNSTAADNTAAQFFFNPDAASNADVAILTDSALTISRNVNVTNNLSTGKSILGGNSANSSTFSGTVALSKNLSVTAASGGPVTFSGNITGSNNVTKEGLGTVKFTTAKAYTGTTSVTAGTLEVDDTLASSAVTVAGGTTLLGTGTLSGALSVSGTLSPGLVVGGNTLHAGATTLTGHLAVQVDDTLNTELISTGTINMTGGTVDVSVGGGGFTQPYYVIAQGSSITGSLPSVTTGYMLTQVGNQLRLSLLVTNSFATWIAGYSVSDSTPGGNPSHDGLTNLVKYALDLNPSVACPPPGTHTGSTLTFTKGAMAKVDSNVAYTIEESTNLVTWGAPTLGSVVYGDTITYTYPSGHAKVFARLKVIQTP